jgi:hypothetical protein
VLAGVIVARLGAHDVVSRDGRGPRHWVRTGHGPVGPGCRAGGRPARLPPRSPGGGCRRVRARRPSARWAAGAWGVVAFVFLQILFGETQRLPGWADGIAPFSHLPGVPVEDFDVFAVLTQLVVAAILVLVGLLGFRTGTSPPPERLTRPSLCRSSRGLGVCPTAEGVPAGRSPSNQGAPTLPGGNGSRHAEAMTPSHSDLSPHDRVEVVHTWTSAPSPILTPASAAGR